MEKRFIEKHNADVLVKGIPITHHIASGKIIFNDDKAISLAREGESVILVRDYIEPDNIESLKLAKGVILAKRDTGIFALTMTKTLKKSCILSTNINIEDNKMLINNQEYLEGTEVSLDGLTGDIYLGLIPQVNMIGYNDLAKQELKRKIYR